MQTAQTLMRGAFFHQDSKHRTKRTAKTQETNCRRQETQELVTRFIALAQLGLLGAAQIARLAGVFRIRERGTEPACQIVPHLPAPLSCSPFGRRVSIGIPTPRSVPVLESISNAP